MTRLGQGRGGVHAADKRIGPLAVGILAVQRARIDRVERVEHLAVPAEALDLSRRVVPVAVVAVRRAERLEDDQRPVGIVCGSRQPARQLLNFGAPFRAVRRIRRIDGVGLVSPVEALRIQDQEVEARDATAGVRPGIALLADLDRELGGREVRWGLVGLGVEVNGVSEDKM